MHMRDNNRKKCVLVTDSEYVYLGIVQNLSTWEQNNFYNAKGKPLAQVELWKIISECAKVVQPRVLHQSSHTVQKTPAAVGNREVDQYVRVRAIIKESEGNLLQELHDKLNHPSTTYVAKYCGQLGLHL